MRTYGKATLAIGLALLVLLGLVPPAFGPPPGPPPPGPGPEQKPLCQITSVGVQGPSEGTVGESLAFQGEAQIENCSGEPQYSWTLAVAPEGAEPWSATGREVPFTPGMAGEYVLRLEVTADSTEGSAEHRLTVAAGEVQEFALILGPGSGLRAFPETLGISAGSLRLFLTLLDRAVTVVIRREGAQMGITTVLAEPGKLTTVEVELDKGVYGLFDRATGSRLGQIEAR